MTDNKQMHIDTFMLSELTGLTHGNIISRVQHLAYDMELSSDEIINCLLYTSPSPRDRTRTRMPSSA